MSTFVRAVPLVAVLLIGLALLYACSGDDEPDDGSDAGSPTPFIAPEAMTTAEALALLEEIEGLVEEPNAALVAVAQVTEGEVQERSLAILNGVDDVSGLDDVRISLETGDRVGAGEYLFNVVRSDTGPLSESDTNEIREDTLDQLDVAGTFDEDHSDGMTVSGIFKDATIKMMELWYGLLGEPPEEATEAT
jgi:hypothetical protein